uniref:Uncharacterized protein n=1 Tax=Thermosporothrix sp. COM3 TaxID=2490863 RepID=A0A455SI77_9CHLR|nr:hypothetical protein KTC_17920 [Thermosporothrix sp. COM3]
MQAHPEQEENNAKFCQFLNCVDVTNKARRERADNDPCQQIANDWREFDKTRDASSYKGNKKSYGDVGKDRKFMHR